MTPGQEWGGREGEGCHGCPPTWPAAVMVLLWPPGRPAGACPPGPSGPTPPRGESRRSRLHFRSGTGAGKSRWPPSRRHPAGCPGRCSGRPLRRGSSGGSRSQRETSVLPSQPTPQPCLGEASHLRQPVHVARACGRQTHGVTRLRRTCSGVLRKHTPHTTAAPTPSAWPCPGGPGRRLEGVPMLAARLPRGLVIGTLPPPPTPAQLKSLSHPEKLRARPGCPYREHRFRGGGGGPSVEA